MKLLTMVARRLVPKLLAQYADSTMAKNLIINMCWKVMISHIGTGVSYVICKALYQNMKEVIALV